MLWNKNPKLSNEFVCKKHFFLKWGDGGRDCYGAQKWKRTYATITMHILRERNVDPDNINKTWESILLKFKTQKLVKDSSKICAWQEYLAQMCARTHTHTYYPSIHTYIHIHTPPTNPLLNFDLISRFVIILLMKNFTYNISVHFMNVISHFIFLQE